MRENVEKKSERIQRRRESTMGSKEEVFELHVVRV